MRIAVDARCVFRGKGGIGRYARGLLGALAWAETAHEFVVLLSALAPADDVALPERFEAYAVPAGMIDEVWEQCHLPTLLARLGADLYFNPTFATPVLASCLRVATVHDVVFERHPELVAPGLREYLRRATRFTVDHADSILTVSKFSKGELCEACGVEPSRVRVVYNGVDARFHPMELSRTRSEQLRQMLGLAQGVGFLLYVGAIEPKKNVKSLLQAFALARGEAPAALVLVGGQGGMAWDPRPVIDELGMADAVRLVGYVPDEMVAELMNLADGFVYPSLYEGFGLPPLEAMACGTPTLVAAASSLPEVTGDGALRVDPQDVDAMAEGLVRLLTDEALRAELARKGRERASEFTWARAALGLLAAFDELDGKPVQPGARPPGAAGVSGGLVAVDSMLRRLR